MTDVFLGRPWRDDAHVAVISSQLGVHINAAGWNDWDRAATHATARFWEFNNLGPGANIASRAAWSRQLSPVEAQKLLDQATAR